MSVVLCCLSVSHWAEKWQEKSGSVEGDGVLTIPKWTYTHVALAQEPNRKKTKPNRKKETPATFEKKKKKVAAEKWT